MKIRTDFVTNSSSSSFIAISIKNQVFTDICKQFEHLIKEFDNEDYEEMSIVLGDDTVMIRVEEGYMDLPSSADEITDGILSVLAPEYIHDESFDEDNQYACIAQAIVERRDEFDAATEYAEFTQSEMGWQGDSEARYDKSNYSAAELDKYMSLCAQENKCSVDEVTDEMWNNYVGDKTSIEDDTFVYQKSTGSTYTTHTMELD